MMILPITSDIASKEVFPSAKNEIVKALESDPDSAEAHTADANECCALVALNGGTF